MTACIALWIIFEKSWEKLLRGSGLVFARRITSRETENPSTFRTSFRYLNSNPVRSRASILALLLTNVSSRFRAARSVRGRVPCRIARAKSDPDFSFLPLFFTKLLHQPRNYEKLVIRFRRCLRLDVVRKKKKRGGGGGKEREEKKRDEGENIPRA